MKVGRVLGQYVVFMVGSGFGAVIDYALTLALVYGFEIDVKFGLAFSMCFSGVTVFLFHYRLTFGPSDQGNIAAMLSRFLVLTIAVYGLRALFLWLFEGLLSVPVSLALALGIVSILNFFASKTLIFKS